MTRRLDDLLRNNREWAEQVRRDDPGFFKRLSGQQAPKYLWIGCSDSRVPANQIMGLAPGEVFVHRNIANVVVHTDLNCLSVIQFAVDVLDIRHVEDVRDAHAEALAAEPDAEARWDRLCELNVVEQVLHLTQTTVMRDAWVRGQDVTVHGWIYSLLDGRLRNLRVSAASPADAARVYADAVRPRVRQP